MHRNLGIQIPLSLVRTQCFWVFDVSFYKNITKMMSQEKTTESLLEIYEKNKDNMNEVNHTYFINKVTKTTCFSGKAPLKVMSDSLSYLYDKL